MGIIAVALCAIPAGPPWLWVLSILSLFLGAISLVWQSFTWWQDRRVRILIRQVGTSVTDTARQIPNVGTVYTVDVAIVNQSPRTPAVVCGLLLKPPWEDNTFNLLPDPRESYPSGEIYVVGGNVERYPRQDVINHRVYEEGRLEVGGVIRGTLLARGPAPIPRSYCNGVSVEFTVSVRDQNNRWHKAQVELKLLPGDKLQHPPRVSR